MLGALSVVVATRAVAMVFTCAPVYMTAGAIHAPTMGVSGEWAQCCQCER